ncbi:MAG: hypothetical protein ACI81L_001291 [Verrucomicrobiales bacterium]
MQEDLTIMTIDDPTSSELASQVRPFTLHHDQILHAVVDQLNEVTARLHALEAAASTHTPPASSTTIDITDGSAAAAGEHDAGESPNPPTAGTATPQWRTKSGRQTGWQPTRR